MEMQMEETSRKQLTIDDPVDTVSLQTLRSIREHRRDVGEKALDLLQEFVQVLVTERKLEEARSRLFEQILVDRGLPIDAVVEVDANTGRLAVHAEAQVPPPSEAQIPAETPPA